MDSSPTVLFICTGNYYRSRFAEYYLLHLLAAENWPGKVFSRGLDIYSAGNPGPVSPITTSYLLQLQVGLPDPMPGPNALTEADFSTADLVVAMDETEHRPMLEKQFPHLLPKVTFWNYADVGFVPSAEMLPLLQQRVEELGRSLLGKG